MRSAREIRYRLGQELNNLTLFLRPPALEKPAAPWPLALPDPEPVIAHLKNSPYALEIVRAAEEILENRIPLFGQTIDFGEQIRWRKDVRHGNETPATYFRRIPYLNFALAGDHKWIWELNRHQHWVLLAQAWRFTRRREFIEAVDQQFASWIAANPLQRGINWTSALEVALRALSWIWVWQLAGDVLAKPSEFLTALFHHGCHLEHNLSRYFSPNTHLLGEAVALHALGTLFPSFPRAADWRATGAAIVREELDHQVHRDGSHFEQASFYHIYALDMFVFHRLLLGDRALPAFDDRLSAMADYLHSLAAGSHPFPYLGDDDGGRFFHPYGDRRCFARATLATSAVLLHRPDLLRSPTDLAEQAAWWIGAKAFEQTACPQIPPARSFADAGIATLRQHDNLILIDAGAFGPGRAGHSHADTLSIVAYAGAAEILIDPGTFTYISDARLRDLFRGTAAHNTISIDGASQADPSGPFGWTHPPEVRVNSSSDCSLDAECRYRGFVHRRRVFWQDSIFWILDLVTGPPGSHHLQQSWHPGMPPKHLGPATFSIEPATLYLAGSASIQMESVWRSRVFNHKEEATAIRAEWDGALPAMLAAALSFGPPAAEPLSMVKESGGVRLAIGPHHAFFAQ